MKQIIQSIPQNPLPDPAKADPVPSGGANSLRFLARQVFDRLWLRRAKNLLAFAVMTGRIRAGVTATDADQALVRTFRSIAARQGGRISAGQLGAIVVVVDEHGPENDLYVLIEAALAKAALARTVQGNENGATRCDG